MKKKLLSILLSIGLVLTMVPATVFADPIYTYTLELPEAKAVYRINTGGSLTEKSVFEGFWFESTDEGKVMFIDETFRNNNEFSTWSAYYEALAEEMATGYVFSKSQDNFELSSDSIMIQSWLLFVLTDSTTITPGAAYAVYYGTSDLAGGAITIDPDPIDTGYLKSDEETSLEEIEAEITFNPEEGTATLTSLEAGGYDVIDVYLSAIKDGEVVYRFVEGQWTPVGAGASLEVLPDDAYDSYLWNLKLKTESSFVFSSSLATIKINGTTINKETPEQANLPVCLTNRFRRVPGGTKLEIFYNQDKPSSLGETKDVIVDYTYTAGGNIAEKVFTVDVEYTLPKTLTAASPKNTYVWDSENGKYVAPQTLNTNNTFELENNGAFSITITNKSNVGIDYTVSYVPNEDAIFTNDLTDEMQNASGTLDTVAQGQEITANGINITNTDFADNDKLTNFKAATCTGALSVTAINGSPLSSGTDKLGTFTINIAEAETAEPAVTISTVGDVLDTAEVKIPEEENFSLYWMTEDTNGAAFLNTDGSLQFSCFYGDEGVCTEIVSLDESVTADNNNYKFTCENGAVITFNMTNNKLTSITISNETGEKAILNNKEFIAPAKMTIADFVAAINEIGEFPTSYSSGYTNSQQSQGNLTLRCYLDGSNLVLYDGETDAKQYPLDTVLYWNGMAQCYTTSMEPPCIEVPTFNGKSTGDYAHIQFIFSESSSATYRNPYIIGLYLFAYENLPKEGYSEGWANNNQTQFKCYHDYIDDFVVLSNNDDVEEKIDIHNVVLFWDTTSNKFKATGITENGKEFTMSVTTNDNTVFGACNKINFTFGSELSSLSGDYTPNN